MKLFSTLLSAQFLNTIIGVLRRLFVGVLRWGIITGMIVVICHVSERLYVSRLLSRTVFPHFHEADWWTVSSNKVIDFGAPPLYEALLSFSPNVIERVIDDEYRKFDLSLTSRSLDGDGGYWEQDRTFQKQMFGKPPQLGCKFQGGHYNPSPRMDFENDTIYYKCSDPSSKVVFGVVVDVTKQFAWVYYLP